MTNRDHPRQHRLSALARTGGRIGVSALIVALAAVSLAACGSDTSSRATTSTPAPTEVQGIQRDQPLEVGAVTLPDVTVGAAAPTFTMRAQPGQLLFVYFGYTHCPDLCPTTLADLRKALTQLDPAEAGRVQLAFVTVDPTRDTADVLNPYLASFVSDATALRTTEPAQLQTAEDAFLASSTVQENADGTVEVSHTAISYLVDDTGRVVDEMPFGTTPDAMASDLRLLLARQSGSTSTTSNPTTNTSKETS